MITEQYVTFETAKLLKEAGFDSPTRGIYRTNRTGDHSFAEYNIKQTVDDLSWNAGDGFQYEYSAPTQSLAARWLREVHHIFLMMAPTLNGWMFDLFHLDKYQYIVCDLRTCEKDYESTFECGLREALKLIINKQGK